MFKQFAVLYALLLVLLIDNLLKNLLLKVISPLILSSILEKLLSLLLLLLILISLLDLSIYFTSEIFVVFLTVFSKTSSPKVLLSKKPLEVLSILNKLMFKLLFLYWFFKLLNLEKDVSSFLLGDILLIIL